MLRDLHDIYTIVRRLGLLFLFAASAYAQSPVTVTGTIYDNTGHLATAGYVKFALSPASSSLLYYVTNIGIIAPQNTNCGINAAGLIKDSINLANPCLVWGNDVITPGNTTYAVTFAPNNVATQTIRQLQITSVCTNLNVPCFVNPVNIVPQYQTITTSPIAVNLVPTAPHVFNVGQAALPYAAGYFDNLFVTTFNPSTINASTAVNSKNINGILYVGPLTGQYTSAQAAHDALPSTGGTIFVMATGTPFGSVGTAPLSITKPIHIIFDVGTFTYTGSAQSILCTSVNTPIIEGSGFQGGGSAGGTIISVTNTSANGADINVCPGAQIRNLTISLPGSGTGKGIIFTGNTGVVENVVEKGAGGNGCEENGTRGNSNGVRWIGVRCVNNGGIGLNVFGANANVNHFEVEVSNNTGLGAQIATSSNVFELLHGFSNNSGGTGFSFISPAGNNSGVFYSDSGTQTTDLGLGAGASNNGWLRLVSGQAFTNAGTNNFIQTSQILSAAGAASSPTHSFIGSPTTGFYDVGGGGVGFSSGGIPSFLYNLNIHRMGANGVLGFSSNADPTAAGNDAGLSRPAAGLVAVGIGTSGNRAGKLTSALVSADGGAVCTNGELVLSANWGNTGAPTITAAAGTGQTCQWTITAGGAATGASPTITDTLTNALVSASTVCDMRMVGGTGTATLINQTSLSATAPVFTFGGTPGAGLTYIVVRRCGP